MYSLPISDIVCTLVLPLRFIYKMISHNFNSVQSFYLMTQGMLQVQGPGAPLIEGDYIIMHEVNMTLIPSGTGRQGAYIEYDLPSPSLQTQWSCKTRKR